MDDQNHFHRLAYALIANAGDLERELEWLAQVLQARLAAYFATPSTSPELPGSGLPPPDISASDSPYAGFLQQHHVSAVQRLVLALALAPVLRPQLLDVLWTRNEATQRGFAEFGGVQVTSGCAFQPTGETACFLLAGDNLAGRFMAAQLFERDQLFARIDMLQLAPAEAGEPPLSGALRPSRHFLGLVTQGEEARLELDAGFPARPVRTEMSWQDLVLPASTLEQLWEIRAWIIHGRTLLEDWGMGRKLRAGHTSLFQGPPGTGKTLSACLLGKLCEREVYKIDLSMVVSKYIGETEKNLSGVFDQAESRDWILFFDEADALFGKRTRVDDARDRYANQEVSFLLQRIEEFSGVVILASNLMDNIDDAFQRRFHTVVQFPMPGPAERLRIWREAFSPRAELEDGLDLRRIAECHELSGGTIMNVVRHVSLKALARGDSVIRADDMDEGIRRELHKEGRAF